MARTDNYLIQAQQAKSCFLTYNAEALAKKLNAKYAVNNNARPKNCHKRRECQTPKLMTDRINIMTNTPPTIASKL